MQLSGLVKLILKDAKLINGLYMIETYKKEIVYDKPIYVGTSVLDLSKLHMMKLHFEVVESNLKNNYDLLYLDTDSFVYNSRCDDVYKWVRDNKTNFDNSVIPITQIRKVLEKSKTN